MLIDNFSFYRSHKITEYCFLVGAGNVNLSVVLRHAGGAGAYYRKTTGQCLNEDINFHNKHCSFQDAKIIS